MTFNILRERLEGLMLFRVVLVTLFLGGSLAANIDALSDFSNVRNATFVVLIVTTYALTILYAMLIRRLGDLAPLAVMQITLDLVIILVLADVTEGMDSPFLFLFLLTVINAAIVIGRWPAVATAAAVTVALVFLAAERLVLDPQGPAPGWMWQDTILRTSLNASASLIVAILAGYLAERLGEATTQLEQQQLNIRELKALNENILASLSSGLTTVDATGNVIFFNRAAEQITGQSADDVLGRPLAEVLPGISQVLEQTDDDGDDPRDRRSESRFIRPDGTEVFLGFSTSALRDASGNEAGEIMIFQDLSEIKRMEAQMRRSERLAAVGRLSAAIAHEIRNPLASISGSVEMLSTEESADDDEALRRIIIREVDRLDQLISDFLEYTRQRPLSPEPRDPVPVVSETLELFNNRRGNETLTVVYEHPESISGDVLVDEEAFHQVLWNLLNNAVEATEDTSDPTIEVTIEDSADGVRISVADNGPGIEPDHMDQVFQPFFTTKPSGTGLGLATIYRLIEDQGGTVAVFSPSDLGGARFVISLPKIAVQDIEGGKKTADH